MPRPARASALTTKLHRVGLQPVPCSGLEHTGTGEGSCSPPAAGRCQGAPHGLGTRARAWGATLTSCPNCAGPRYEVYPVVWEARAGLTLVLGLRMDTQRSLDGVASPSEQGMGPQAHVCPALAGISAWLSGGPTSAPPWLTSPHGSLVDVWAAGSPLSPSLPSPTSRVLLVQAQLLKLPH